MKGDGVEVDCGLTHGIVTVVENEIRCGLFLKSVTVFTSGGYGVSFKLVGGFNGKPERVIVL